MKTTIINCLESYVKKYRDKEKTIENRSLLESPYMLGYFEAKDILNLKQALNDIREYVKSTGLYETNINPDKPNICNLELLRINDKFLQIIDKVLGSDK